MTAKKKPTAYGRHISFARGMTADVEAPHKEWLDEAQRRLQTHDEFVAAAELAIMAAPLDLPDDYAHRDWYLALTAALAKARPAARSAP